MWGPGELNDITRDRLSMLCVHFSIRPVITYS